MGYMSDKYYVIMSNDEGGVYINECTKKEVLDRLDPESGYGEQIFCPTIPSTSSENWKENQGIIIKGEIVVPKPKEVIKEWDII